MSLLRQDGRLGPPISKRLPFGMRFVFCVTVTWFVATPSLTVPAGVCCTYKRIRIAEGGAENLSDLHKFRLKRLGIRPVVNLSEAIRDFRPVPPSVQCSDES